MKVTLTKSPNKQAEKRRKRKRRKGSISTTGKPRENVGSHVAVDLNVGSQVAVDLSHTLILKKTYLPEASEAVKRNQRNRSRFSILRYL